MSPVRDLLENKCDKILPDGSYSFGNTRIYHIEEDGFHKLDISNTFNNNTVHLQVKRLSSYELDCILKNMETASEESSIEEIRDIARRDLGKFECIISKKGASISSNRSYYMDNFETGFHLKGEGDVVNVTSDSLDICATGIPGVLYDRYLRDVPSYELKTKLIGLLADNRIAILAPSETGDIFMKAIPDNKLYMHEPKHIQNHEDTDFQDRETLIAAIDLVLRKAKARESRGEMPTIESIRVTQTEARLAKHSDGFDKFGTMSIEGHDVAVEINDGLHTITFLGEDRPWTATLKVKELGDEDIEAIKECLRADMTHGGPDSKREVDGIFDCKILNDNPYIETLKKVAHENHGSIEFSRKDNDYFYRMDYGTDVEIITFPTDFNDTVNIRINDTLWASNVHFEDIDYYHLPDLDKNELREILMDMCAESGVNLHIGDSVPYVRIFTGGTNRISVLCGSKSLRIEDDGCIGKGQIIESLICKYMTRQAIGEEMLQEGVNNVSAYRADFTSGTICFYASKSNYNVSITKYEDDADSSKVVITWPTPISGRTIYAQCDYNNAEYYLIEGKKPEAVAREITQLQSACDENGNGETFASELKTLIKSMGKQITKEESADEEKEGSR